MSLVPINGLWETHVLLDRTAKTVDAPAMEHAHVTDGNETPLRFPGGCCRRNRIVALNDAGLQPTGLTGQPIDEPEVIPWIPAASVYFQDPDGHSLEYIAMFPEAPAPAEKQMPLSEWRNLQRGV